MRNALREAMLALADHEHFRARARVHEESAKLGSIVPIRRGHSIVDSWKEGVAFSDIRKRLDRITSERAELQTQKKSIEDKLKQNPDDTYWNLQSEARKLRLEELKKV
jgi:hypothetical protein